MTEIDSTVCRLLGSSSCEWLEDIQSLWSGYGVIRRAHVDDRSVVVKHIDISQTRENRRGWNSDISHQRKLDSYQNEAHFYSEFASRCDSNCRVPGLLGSLIEPDSSDWLLSLIHI